MSNRRSKFVLVLISIVLVLPLTLTKIESQRANIVSFILLSGYLSLVTLNAFSRRPMSAKFVFLGILAGCVAPLHVLLMEFMTTKDFSDWIVTSLLLLPALVLYAIIVVIVASLVTRTNPLNN